jgi:hypothetical protein
MTIQADIDLLSHFYPLWADKWYRFVIVDGIKLPRGYNRKRTQVLITIPNDYPMTPPGITPHLVYVPSDLRFHCFKPKDMHLRRTPQYETPGFGPWAWWCYESITWQPLHDTLLTFVAMVRSDFAKPPLEDKVLPDVLDMPIVNHLKPVLSWLRRT